jgi:hypothetical protein
MADGLLEGVERGDVVVGGRDQHPRPGGAPLQGEGGQADAGRRIPADRLEHALLVREAGQLLADDGQQIPSRGHQHPVPAGEGRRPLDRVLEEAAAPEQRRELLGVRRGGQGPEPLAASAGHDHDVQVAHRPPPVARPAALPPRRSALGTRLSPARP